MNNKTEFVCIVCPMGCQLTAQKAGDDYAISGNSCPRGEKYGKQEMVYPIRHISSTIKVENGFLKLCPVKTETEIPKDMIFPVMKVINEIKVQAPIKSGQLIVENILETGVNIIASRDIDRREE